MTTATVDRESIVFDGDVDYDDLSKRGVIKFREGENYHTPLTLSQVKQLREVEKVKGGSDGVLADLLNFAERLDNEMGDDIDVGLIGFMTTPSHPNHPMTIIDGLTATTIKGEISMETQRDCFKTFRYADALASEGDGIYIWYD